MSVGGVEGRGGGWLIRKRRDDEKERKRVCVDECPYLFACEVSAVTELARIGREDDWNGTKLVRRKETGETERRVA